MATLVEVMKFFGIPIATFRKEWALLEDAEKDQLRKGIGDGSYAY